MKILSAAQIRDLDGYTIANEPISSIDLMERASQKFCEAFINHMQMRYHAFDKHTAIYIFCGMGNNGGDGLAIARLLHLQGYNVKVYVVHHADKASSDCATNLQRWQALGSVAEIHSIADVPLIEDNSIVIDAIFGNGLSRAVAGIAADVIKAANSSNAFIVSVDMPSGLYADSANDNADVIIHAALTLTFHSPKLTFLLPHSGPYCGQVEVLNIGLDKNHADAFEGNRYYLTADDVRQRIKPRNKFSHKGTYGHALIVAGGEGKMGAAVLCARAALRSGAGLVSCYCPQGKTDILQVAAPEAMIALKQQIEQAEELQKYSAIGIGPGLGVTHDVADLIEHLCTAYAKPLVLDADALNTIAMKPNLLSMLPKGSVITPHPKEFQRLVGGWSSDIHRLQKQVELAVKHHIAVVLKGAHTSIALPDGSVYFNSTGNAGMAKGGSGDVLTGTITALMAQGYLCAEAALLGVYLHGLAGDLAAGITGLTAMRAGDIIDSLPGAFISFE